MKLSQHRILTTHVGSLPRSEEVFKLVFAKEAGEKIDMNYYDQVIADAVKTVVRKQTEVGVDVVSDGEQSKISYATYIKHRLNGFDGDSPRRTRSPGTVTVETVQSVFDVSCITDLTLFSVTDHIHSDFGLLTDHGLNRISYDLVIVVHVNFFACLLGKYQLKDLFRTGEAADMGGEDSVLTQFHRYRLIWGKC